jgi:phosphoglycerol transferase MdoB-like AlkP superfamily enzyme
MKDKILFFLKYILFWIGIQFFFRLMFLILYGHLAEEISFKAALLTFVYGLKHDLFITGYILIIPALAITVLPFFRENLIKKGILVYSGIVLMILVLLYITNLVMYEFWNYPIDKSIFDYLGSPREYLANTKTIQVFLLLIIWLSLYLLFWSVIFKKWITNNIKVLKPGWSSLVFIILLFPLLILPIKSKAGTIRVNYGSVYFNRIELLNHAAVNPVWNVFYSISKNNPLSEKFSFISEEEAVSVNDSLHPDNRTVPYVLNNNRPNIVIIMLESFASNITESGGNQKVTPAFNSLMKEGIFFNNFFATGSMTDRALAGIISGYPALPGDCIIHFKKKTQTLPFISKDLQTAGYSTTFIYGGDINFANMKSYLVAGDFEKIISDNDDNYSSSIDRTKWGLPDEIVFDRLFEECHQVKEPFFIFCLTLSNHHPFDVPMEPVFPGNSYEDIFFNASYYSDKCLGEFMSKAKSAEWYKNTLFVIVADHGSRIENENEFDLKRVRIPMLWLGGAVKSGSAVIDHYGSQTDFAKTLLGQLDLPASKYIFSKNLLDPESPSFAYYSCQNGFGIISDSLHLVYHIPASKFSTEIGTETSRWRETSLAFMKYLSSDFNKR